MKIRKWTKLLVISVVIGAIWSLFSVYGAFACNWQEGSQRHGVFWTLCDFPLNVIVFLPISILYYFSEFLIKVNIFTHEDIGHIITKTFPYGLIVPMVIGFIVVLTGLTIIHYSLKFLEKKR